MVSLGDQEILGEQAQNIGAWLLTKPLKLDSLPGLLRRLSGPRDDAPGPAMDNTDDQDFVIPGLVGVHILLVEDNPVNQLVQREILEQAGLKVEVAANGSQALARIESLVPDLVLMDVQMPVLDGLSASRGIRANPDLRDLPIIGMTAYTRNKERELCFEAGMDAYLPKPVDPDRLLSLIRQLTSSSSGRSGTSGQTPAEIELDKAQAVGDSLAGQEGCLPVFDVQEGLSRLGGKWHFLRNSLNVFVENYAQAGGTISKMLQEGDRKKAAAYCHTLKGAVDIVCAKRLYPVVCALEQELEGEKPVEEILGIQQLEEELHKLTETVRQLDL